MKMKIKIYGFEYNNFFFPLGERKREWRGNRQTSAAHIAREIAS